jgi:hypothetical protein
MEIATAILDLPTPAPASHPTAAGPMSGRPLLFDGALSDLPPEGGLCWRTAPDGRRLAHLGAHGPYDRWLVEWPAGVLVDVHAHGRAASVVRVLAGSLAELRSDGRSLRPRPLGPGRCSWLAPGLAHGLRNPGPGPARSLHVLCPAATAPGPAACGADWRRPPL